MPSKTDIWMPLYIGDYLAATSHLSALESGAYLHLLMHQWKNGQLPSDLEALRRIARVDKDAWSNAWAMLTTFFDDATGFPVQQRLETIRDEWNEKKVKSQEKARAAAQARWKTDAPSNAQAVPHTCPSPSSSPTQKDKDKSAPLAFDGHMVAQAFLQSNGLSGSELARNISDAARAAIAAGQDGLDVLSEMESAWSEWCAAKSAGKLGATFSAEKFFGNGMWKDKAGWPWRNDGSNQQNQAGRVSPATERKAHADQTTKNILARRYGIDVDGAHTASGGPVSGSGDRGSDQGNVPGGMGGDGSEVRPAHPAGRVIEGDHSEQILPRAG